MVYQCHVNSVLHTGFTFRWESPGFVIRISRHWPGAEFPPEGEAWVADALDILDEFGPNSDQWHKHLANCEGIA